MTMTAEQLLPAKQRSRRGQWSGWRSAPPVTASDIRRWAIAVYWPEPPPARFVDEKVAAASKWGGLIAPQELNPFAWAPGGPPRTPALPGVRRLLGGYRIEYGVPIRVGDVIRRRSRLDGWEAKSGPTGDLLLVYHTHEWRNQGDATVRTALYTLIYRGAVSASG